ncbi:hypothetical protein FHG87_015178 [Trinorchestia longiramus]|nr:hypothetical protein FHG87_015178 [Trinorchestia longiramus]
MSVGSLDLVTSSAPVLGGPGAPRSTPTLLSSTPHTHTPLWPPAHSLPVGACIFCALALPSPERSPHSCVRTRLHVHFYLVGGTCTLLLLLPRRAHAFQRRCRLALMTHTPCACVARPPPTWCISPALCDTCVAPPLPPPGCAIPVLLRFAKYVFHMHDVNEVHCVVLHKRTHNMMCLYSTDPSILEFTLNCEARPWMMVPNVARPRRLVDHELCSAFSSVHTVPSEMKLRVEVTGGMCFLFLVLYRSSAAATGGVRAASAAASVAARHSAGVAATLLTGEWRHTLACSEWRTGVLPDGDASVMPLLTTHMTCPAAPLAGLPTSSSLLLR